MKAYSTIISAVFISACLILPADARNGRDWTPEHDGNRYGYSVRIGVGGYPLFQVAPVGITAGRRLYWFAECGIGMVYVGGKTGIGIRF